MRAMRRGIGCVVVLVALTFVASAGADTLCVPSNSIPGCPSPGGLSEPTIADAVTNGNNGDTVLIAADSYNAGHAYNESVTDSGKSLKFIGAGVGKTIIQGQSVAAMTLSSGSSVTNLTIDLAGGTGRAGLVLAGSATNVAIIATQPLSTNNSIGVELNGGTFSHGTITLPITGTDDFHYGGAVGLGTLADSTVTAAVGVTSDPSGGTPTVHRVHILANQGVLTGTTTFWIDDSVIRTEPGAAPELGIGLASNMINGSWIAHHVDVIGSGTAGSTGASLGAAGVFGPATSTATLSSAIVRGFATPIAVSAIGGPAPAFATVIVQRSFYDRSRSSTTATPLGTATISQDTASGNFDPEFVSPTDLHLKAGSPAIDAGDPTLASGETTDLDGHPRAIVGKKGDAAISDVGAYEFQPHQPTVSASASSVKVHGYRKVRFAATGSDASPGDAVTFTWRFDDGASATGPSVSHAFRSGRHTATVTATDLDHFTASATVTITVIGPSLSKLHARSRPQAARLSYRDTERAITTFELFRIGSKRPLRTVVHHDKAGKNQLKLKSLLPGRYRLVAVPRNRAGRGKAVVVRFRVRG
jgi:hypothetical protein